MSSTPLSAAQLQKHPEFPHVNWDLTPTKKGTIAAAKDRGGPINIAFETHGTGPSYIVWIMGLGSMKTAWQRQTRDFGHTQGDKYTCLLIENRGVGESDKPLMRYSTSEMAKDITEVLDHLEWTKERQLNVVGISLGGMIAQELGLLVPKRIASLSLVSTAAAIKNTVGFIENLRNRINLFIPRSLDAQVAMIKHNLFSPEWLSQPDESEFVKEKFPTNGDRIGAGEVAKRMDTVSYPRSGFVSQALAAGWHYKSPEQLASLGDQVGRERIMVVHGGVDRMITIPHVHVLINGLGGEGSGIAIKLEPGQGHVLPIEMRKTFNGWVEELVDKAEQLSRE
ncbi:putative alpha beta hydrolase protein [Venturia nashicola]|uniref:Putative alpha beta hydrolase protein n=1 Tax=Venturia nashicola TaxID=86259 RepID=A0A4Z1PQ12_9PEZI|nr:putative alpha beta hydrolase protein [Venturia nashicola]